MFALWFLLSSPSSSIYLSFFLALSQPSQIGCIPYFHTWCGLTANLKRRSETCCTRGSLKIQDAKNRQKSASGQHGTSLSCYIFATDAFIDNRKKVLNSNTSLTCPHNMVKFSPLTAEIGLQVWGTPSNFNGFLVLASLLHRSRGKRRGLAHLSFIHP